jgi:hypothetical protein
MSDTLAVTRTQIKEMAIDALSRHQVTVVAPAPSALYKCARPGSWCYGFFVGFPPGAVIFYGDLGEATLRPHAADSLAWLRGSTGSEGYLIEKIKPQPTQEFYRSDAHAWLDELANDLRAEGLAFDEEADLRTTLDDDCSSPDEFARALSANGLLDGCVPGLGPSNSTLWMIEALRWFVAHVDEASQ